MSKTLDVKTRDAIALALSEADGCEYCLAAHSYMAANFARLTPEEIALNRQGKSGESPRRNIVLPLDLRASGFAAHVYRAVLGIPFGQTRTFAEVARAVGAPKAVRAVGNACARNPIEFAIPCHRVLRSDGRWAGGGDWGDWRQSVIVGCEKAALGISGEQA